MIGLTAGFILTGERGHGTTGIEPGDNLAFLIFTQARRSAKFLAGPTRPAQPGLGALNHKVTLEFGDGRDDLHRHSPRRTGQVDTAQGEAVNPHADRVKGVDRGANIHRITTKTVELGDDENVISFQSIDEAAEGWSLHRGYTTRDRVGHDTRGLDGKPGRLGFGNQVRGSLTKGRYAGVDEGTGHRVKFCPKWVPDNYLCSKPRQLYILGRYFRGARIRSIVLSLPQT